MTTKTTTPRKRTRSKAAADKGTAAAKVKENAERVADLNAADEALEAMLDAAAGSPAPGRGRSANDEPEAFMAAVTAVLAGADPEATAAEMVKPKTAKQKKAAKALEEARTALAEARQASTDRIERHKLAKAEAKELKAWKDAGSQGERPATPNLDAIEAKAPVKATKKAGATKKAKTVTTRSTNPRYVASQQEARKGVPRGKGTKVTDEELDAWIKLVTDEDPTLTRNQAEQISYWIERRAVGIDRFNAAFARVTGR